MARAARPRLVRPLTGSGGLSVDERLVKRARRSAAAMGKSRNQLVREFFESLTEQGNAEAFERELRQLSARSGGKRRRWRFNRDEAHGRT